jgi:hypothetical protein
MRWRIAAFLVLPLACASEPARPWPAGENPVIETPALTSDEWSVFSKQEGPSRSRLWQSKARGTDDVFVVTTIRLGSIEPRVFRDVQDGPGRESCDRFESIDLVRKESDGLPAELWRTECFLAGELATQIVQVVIVGRESLYHVQKVWKGAVPEAGRADWIERISSVYICDTRGIGRPCPANVELVATPEDVAIAEP